MDTRDENGSDPSTVPWIKIVVAWCGWYLVLLVFNTRINAPTFAQAAVFYALWTLPGVALALLVARRAGVTLVPVALPLSMLPVATTTAFFATGQFDCRVGARPQFGLGLIWGTMISVALSSLLARIQIGRMRWLPLAIALAGAAIMGFLEFVEGENCDFGQTVEGGLLTFFWPALLMFTVLPALVGNLLGFAYCRVRSDRQATEAGAGGPS